MATRRPLVINDGLLSELLVGDTVTAGTSTTQVVAGSGLTGGGSLSNNPALDLALAPNASGIIFVGDTIGIDGAAQTLANVALASGSVAATVASNALASGNNSLAVGTAALASGNAALALLPSLGGGGTTATFTAASAIASGYAVGVDDAGKVQTVRNVVTEGLTFPSSPELFEVGTTAYTASCFDTSNNKVIVGYSDIGNSSYGTAVVGAVSGTSISYGTPIVFASVVVDSLSVVFSTTDNVVVFIYRNGSNNGYGTYRAGSVSGTSITFGTAATFRSFTSAGIVSTFDSTNNKVVVALRDITNGIGVALVGTLSGFTMNFGSAVAYSSNSTQDLSIAYNSTADKILIAFRDNGNSAYGTAIVGQVSGSSISFGSAGVFESAITSFTASTYDSANNKILISYRWTFSTNNFGLARIITISGTSFSFTSSFVFSAAHPSDICSVYDSTSSKIVIAFKDIDNSNYGTALAATISGSTVSFTSPVVFINAPANYPSITYDSTNNRVVISYNNGNSSFFGFSIVAGPLFTVSYYPTLNSYPNVLGISQSTVASGSPCVVNLPGTLYNNPAANFTAGSFYYPNPTTSGVTTSSTKPSSWNGQVPWNYIGRAVTSSGLMLLKSI